MPRLSLLFADNIVLSCLDLLNKLPKTGKPVEGEWTVLSCVVLLDTETGNHEVVSLGTGSKCIGASKMSPQGDILNDSHAEVIARRGFLVYLYDNISLALEGKDSVFVVEENSLKVKENVEFVFYSSQLPCGDASIMPKSGNEDDFGEVLKQKRLADSPGCDTKAKRPKPENGDETNEKTITTIETNSLDQNTSLHCETHHDTALHEQKTEPDFKTDPTSNPKDSIQESQCTKQNQVSDIHRTGAKCLPDSEQDPKQAGTKYHLLGKVRIKPGRGDRTLSVSCSDKLARWVHVGIQGALIDLLCGPIYLKHIIFGSGVPYSKEALHRALFQRHEIRSQLNSLKSVPELYQSSVEFTYLRKQKNIRPASGSIVWIKSHNIEVAVQGKKLGVTKKNLKSVNNFLCISKYKLYERFLTILHQNQTIREIITPNECLENIPYNAMKRRAKRYVENWSEVKEKFFGTWPMKPDMWTVTGKEQ